MNTSIFGRSTRSVSISGRVQKSDYPGCPGSGHGLRAVGPTDAPQLITWKNRDSLSRQDMGPCCYTP